MTPTAGTAPAAAANGHRSARDTAALLFTGQMYGLQLDQLAAVLRVGEPRARAIVARWRAQGRADLARLGPGPAWVWLTRGGLADCGLPYTAAPPALSRLAHLRAVTAVRLALEVTAGYAAAGAFWRSERKLRSRLGGRVGQREHVPDGEVHWPDECGVAWAGECWAIEAELTRKTVRRTAAIMHELLTRTGDYGCPAATARQPGAAPRHARVIYLCSAAALPVVVRARQALGSSAHRIEIRSLPPGAALAAVTGRAPTGGHPASPGPASPGHPAAPGHPTAPGHPAAPSNPAAPSHPTAPGNPAAPDHPAAW